MVELTDVMKRTVITANTATLLPSPAPRNIDSDMIAASTHTSTATARMSP